MQGLEAAAGAGMAGPDSPRTGHRHFASAAGSLAAGAADGEGGGLGAGGKAELEQKVAAALRTLHLVGLRFRGFGVLGFRFRVPILLKP